MRASLGLCAGLLASACLRPSEDRARRDAEIGIAEEPGVRLVIDEGHAAVRELAREGAVLWQNAPVLRWSIELADAPPSFDLRVRNCMLGAEHAVADAKVEARRRVRELDAPAQHGRVLPQHGALARELPYRGVALVDDQTHAGLFGNADLRVAPRAVFTRAQASAGEQARAQT